MTILIILTAVALLAIILGAILKKEILWFPGLVVLLFTAGFGWVIYGVTCVHSMETIQIKDPIVSKSKTTVFVEYGGDTYTFKNHEDYLNMNDSTTTYYLTTKYNLYGFETGIREITYKNKK